MALPQGLQRPRQTSTAAGHCRQPLKHSPVPVRRSSPDVLRQQAKPAVRECLTHSARTIAYANNNCL
jgi:hypothetical protein